MARAVGIELTETSARILSLERNGKATKILQFIEAPIPAEPDVPWEKSAARALKDALAAGKVPRAQVVAALDSGDAILREISLPFKNEDQIRRTARFEMESQVHNYTIEQLVVAHYKTGETDKGSLLLAAAVPKELIRKRLQVLQEAGVDPVSLDLDACAIFNAMLHAGAVDAEQPHLLVYGTAKFTKILLIEQKQPRSIRTIRFSMKPGEGQGALVEILSREISRFLLGNAAGAHPAQILLTGDFENAESARLLETATGIPVRMVNLLERVEHPFGAAPPETLPPPPAAEPPDQSSRLGVALGLALKGVGVDALGMDFRQDEFSYRKRYEKIKGTLLITVELGIILLAAVALHLHLKRSDIRADKAKVMTWHQEVYENLTDQKLKDPALAYARTKELLYKYEGAHGETPIKKTAREAWRELSQAMVEFQRKYANQTFGEGPIYVEIEGLEIRQSTVSGNEGFDLFLRGKIQNLEWAAPFKGEITAVELFKDADYQGPLTPVGDLVQFTIKASGSRRKGG